MSCFTDSGLVQYSIVLVLFAFSIGVIIHSVWEMRPSKDNELEDFSDIDHA